MKRNIFSLLTVLGAILSLSACNGILEGIYDEPATDTDTDYGFINHVTNESGVTGTVSIDATSYTRWTYIDFHTQKIDSVEITPDAETPEQWDIAIHRYDVKTNGGTVLETGFTGLATLLSSGGIPQGTFVVDEWTTDKIIVDMSTMADGYLGYAESDYNAELSKWLNVDKSSMPPIYTPSNKVYLLKLKDGSMAAIRLQSYMNAKAVKGYMTFDYIYPFEL